MEETADSVGDNEGDHIDIDIHVGHVWNSVKGGCDNIDIDIHQFSLICFDNSLSSTSSKRMFASNVANELRYSSTFLFSLLRWFFSNLIIRLKRTWKWE